MINEIDTLQAILEFWFGAPGSNHFLQYRPEWFIADPAFDSLIRERFSDATSRALAGQFDDWEQCPGGMLGLILLTDQFPRNIHRGTPQAFSGDSRALRLAHQMVSSGWDHGRHPIERIFIYLPFEHSEQIDDQNRSVDLFSHLSMLKEHTMLSHHAEEHRNLIRRFRRFPSRNAILGRDSTADELTYLAAR